MPALANQLGGLVCTFRHLFKYRGVRPFLKHIVVAVGNRCLRFCDADNTGNERLIGAKSLKSQFHT